MDKKEIFWVKIRRQLLCVKYGLKKSNQSSWGAATRHPRVVEKRTPKMTIFDPQVYGECLEKCKFGRTFGSWGLKYRPKNGEKIG